jgi:hypothetical protein
MRKAWIGVVLMSLVAMVFPAAVDAATKPPRVSLTMSNFRYCKASECSPTDIGYLRTDSGPVMGTDNPQATIDVKRGSIVVWVYRDAQCDGADGCPGHNIYYENGATGVRKGMAPARKGLRTITARVTEKRGTTIRYFCTVNGHYMIGMTGILRVT